MLRTPCYIYRRATRPCYFHTAQLTHVKTHGKAAFYETFLIKILKLLLQILRLSLSQRIHQC